MTRRRVFRNRRLQFAGSLMVLVAVMLLFGAVETIDTPVLAVLCVVCAVAPVWFAYRALRVVLVVDETGLTIRNQGETVNVRWESKPALSCATGRRPRRR